MKLKHGVWVVVADGEKFLLLRNNMDSQDMDLRVIGEDEIANPPAREQSSDRSGRMNDDGPGAKSALAETDWHKVAKERFAEELADKLETAARKDRFSEIVIVADPHSLGQLRKALGDATRARVIAEFDKDLTNMPVHEIEKALEGA